MADTDMNPAGAAAADSSEPVGTRLRLAREAAGLGLPQVSALTKIPARMLALIENGDFAALPARTYATGFTRTYARALGLDEVAYVDAVREELGLAGRVDPQPAAAFEPGDPARVPTARLAWLAALGAIGVIVAGAFLWRTYYAPAVTLPSLLPAEEASTAAPAVLPEPAPLVEDSAVPTEAATADPVASVPARPRLRVGSGRTGASAGRQGPVAPGDGAAAVAPVDAVRVPLPASTGAN